MVQRVCQRVLGNAADADDAFQATFVVLMRKASSVRWQSSVGNWLYGVAYRISLDARKRAERRKHHERASTNSPALDPASDIDAREAQAIVDEELATISDQHRAPLVLCYLEGATHEEAAQQLGWSLATLKRRLARGLEVLEARLRGRGLAVPGALIAATIAGSLVSADVAAAAMTAALTNLVTAGNTGASALSANVAHLADRYLRDLVLARVKSLILALTLVGALTAGLGWIAAPYLDATPTDALAVPEGPRVPPVRIEKKKPPASLARADVRTLIDAADKLADDEQKLHLLVRMAPAQAKAGEMDLAKKTLQEAADLAARLDAGVEFPRLAYNVIGAEAEAGFTDDALKTVGALTNPYERLGCLADIAAHQARQRDFDGAQKTMDAIAALRKAPFPPPRPGARSQDALVDESLAVALRNLSWSQMAAREYLAALQSVRKVPRDVDRIVPLTEVASALAKNGHPAEAQEALQEALALFRVAAAAELLNVRDAHHMLACLAAAQFRLGDKEAADALAASLEGESRDPYLRAQAHVHIQAGEFAQAREIARTLSNPANRRDIVSALCCARARQGECAAAEKDVQRLLDGTDRCMTLTELAVIVAEVGKPRDAVHMLEKARDGVIAARRADPASDLRWSGHREVARAFALIGERERALAWAASETPAVRAWILLGIAEGQLRKESPAKRTGKRRRRRRAP
jgi:RNA polymerase sigma factor (sigma-70 family)